MTKKTWLSMACFLGLAGIAWATTGPTIAAQVIRLVQGGTLVWTQSVNAANQLVFRENITLNAPVLTLDDAAGALILRGRTSAQILAAVSPVGGVMFNSTTHTICVSSATAAGTTGAWIYLSTTTTQANLPCN